MSRVGNKPIPIPDKVEVTIEGNEVTVKGPKGTLTRKFHPEMKIELKDGELIVQRPSDEKRHKALHGLTRSLLNNMVVGVTEGFTKRLELSGVGYRAALQGKKLVLSLGYSHPIEVEPEEGTEFEVPANNKIVVKGIDKEVVGRVAAKIRALRDPDPYNVKGVKYEGEHIRRKVGKTG